MRPWFQIPTKGGINKPIPTQQPASSTNVNLRNPMLDMQVMQRQQLQQDLYQQAQQGNPEAEQQFRETFGTSTHRYRYDNDPQYREETNKATREHTGAKIDYPSTDQRRIGNENPHTAWMYGNLSGELNKQMGNFSNEVIATALPIPVLQSMGKIPSVFKVGKNLVKGGSKVDDIIKLYHGGLDDAVKTIDDVDLMRTAQKQNKKGRDYSGFYMYDESQKAGAVTYAEQSSGNLHSINIKGDAKIKELGNIERMTKVDLQKYADEGYDVLKGTDIRGRTEYVLLNKKAVKELELVDMDIMKKVNKQFTPEDVEKYRRGLVDNVDFNISITKNPNLKNLEYHGIAKGDSKTQFQNLENLLTKGIDKDKLFYSSSLNSVNRNLVRTDGMFLTTVKDGKIDKVFINTGDGSKYAGVLKTVLKEKYPNTNFYLYNEADKVIPAGGYKKTILEKHTKKLAEQAGKEHALKQQQILKYEESLKNLKPNELPGPPIETDSLFELGGYIQRRRRIT